MEKILSRTSWKVGEKEYRIAWCNQIEGGRGGKDTLGYCDRRSGIIYLQESRPIEETFSTLIHELLHAIQGPEDVRMNHPTVYKLERALFSLLTENDFI